MTRKPISIERLLNSALGADAMMGPDFKREVDLTPKERERPEAWRRWARQRRRRSAVFVPTGGKTKDEIVRDMAAAMRKAGMFKE